MAKNQKETTKEKSAKLMRGILSWGNDVNEYVNEELYNSKVQKRLKLKYGFDPIRIRSCIDLINDTENAIYYFCEYGLEKYEKKIGKDLGEIYLKLYGILNAIYLQMSSIVELYEILNIPNKSEVVNNLRKLKIFELRNIAGSHTINFEDRSEYIPSNFNKNFFRITQMQLDSKSENLHAVDGFHNIREFNLYELVLEYNTLSEKYLFDAVFHYYKSILPNGNKSMDKWISEEKLAPFSHFDYSDLYKKDIVSEKELDRIKVSIKKHQ